MYTPCIPPQVNPGSPASDAGLREGDVISSMGDAETYTLTNNEAQIVHRNAMLELKLKLNHLSRLITAVVRVQVHVEDRPRLLKELLHHLQPHVPGLGQDAVDHGDEERHRDTEQVEGAVEVRGVHEQREHHEPRHQEHARQAAREALAERAHVGREELARQEVGQRLHAQLHGEHQQAGHGQRGPLHGRGEEPQLDEVDAGGEAGQAERRRHDRAHVHGAPVVLGQQLREQQAGREPDDREQDGGEVALAAGDAVSARVVERRVVVAAAARLNGAVATRVEDLVEDGDDVGAQDGHPAELLDDAQQQHDEEWLVDLGVSAHVAPHRAVPPLLAQLGQAGGGGQQRHGPREQRDLVPADGEAQRVHDQAAQASERERLTVARLISEGQLSISPEDALPQAVGAPHVLGGDLHGVHGGGDERVADADQDARGVEEGHQVEAVGGRGEQPGERVGQGGQEEDLRAPTEGKITHLIVDASGRRNLYWVLPSWARTFAGRSR
ncbi:unnamed protein product [Sphagnum tenellum]